MCKPVDEIIIRHSERAGYVRLTQRNAILKHFPDVKENIKIKHFLLCRMHKKIRLRKTIHVVLLQPIA